MQHRDWRATVAMGALMIASPGAGVTTNQLDGIRDAIVLGANQNQVSWFESRARRNAGGAGPDKAGGGAGIGRAGTNDVPNIMPGQERSFSDGPTDMTGAYD